MVLDGFDICLKFLWNSYEKPRWGKLLMVFLAEKFNIYWRKGWKAYTSDIWRPFRETTFHLIWTCRLETYFKFKLSIALENEI